MVSQIFPGKRRRRYDDDVDVDGGQFLSALRLCVDETFFEFDERVFEKDDDDDVEFSTRARDWKEKVHGEERNAAWRST